jgi:ABC-type dipeptide/oligopeptide/nickel transport system permease component
MMWVYVVRRLVWLPFALMAVSIVTFGLGRIAPGDPVEVILGARATPEAVERLRASMGLDKHIVVQYGEYMWNFIHGDLGESYTYRGRPVTSLIGSKMWVSAQLGIAASIISVAIGLPLGFFVAHKQAQWQDPVTIASAVFLMSVPVAVSAPLMLWAFCLKLDIVPHCSGWGGLFDSRIIIPALIMGVPGIAGFARMMRASTLDVLGQDFIRTAQAKGLSGLVIDKRHVLRNAMIPIITIFGFLLAGLIGGAFITETILGIPGVGRLFVESIFSRDYPVIMAGTLIGAAAFVLANLIADISYALIDPRIRYR